MFGRSVGGSAALSLCLALPGAAQQPPDASAGKKDQPTAVKESLQKSMAALRQYQWVETTAVSIKGEEKSRMEANCYYGADGKLQTPLPRRPGGGREEVQGPAGEDR